LDRQLPTFDSTFQTRSAPDNFTEPPYGKDPDTGVIVYKCHGKCIDCKVCYSGKKDFAIIELEKNQLGRYNTWLSKLGSDERGVSERRSKNRIKPKYKQLVTVMPYRPTSMRR
jgi:hypothetical protein